MSCKFFFLKKQNNILNYSAENRCQNVEQKITLKVQINDEITLRTKKILKGIFLKGQFEICFETVAMAIFICQNL